MNLHKFPVQELKAICSLAPQAFLSGCLATSANLLAARVLIAFRTNNSSRKSPKCVDTESKKSVTKDEICAMTSDLACATSVSCKFKMIIIDLHQ
jgi:hypothetical protein